MQCSAPLHLLLLHTSLSNSKNSYNSPPQLNGRDPISSCPHGAIFSEKKPASDGYAHNHTVPKSPRRRLNFSGRPAKNSQKKKKPATACTARCPLAMFPAFPTPNSLTRGGQPVGPTCLSGWAVVVPTNLVTWRYCPPPHDAKIRAGNSSAPARQTCSKSKYYFLSRDFSDFFF